jgi:excisionase family DNA binding protein
MENERLLNVIELAEYLGVPRSRIYNMVFRRQLPFFKIGRSVRFKASDIRRYLESSLTRPALTLEHGMRGK